MFQFITITYNHEKYIIEHLESLKYQIERYKIKSPILTVCDDSSTDRTIYLVEKWIEKNNALFIENKILTNKVNEGVVSNFTRAIQNIKYDQYKILAGDDLYYCNNIEKVLGEYDFVATPVITFNQDFKIKSNVSQGYFINSTKKVKKRLEKENPFSAPGVFIKKQIIEESNLISHISRFKWIEDYPLWQYIFIKKEKLLNYKYKSTPYIMYRTNVGICSKNEQLTEKNRKFVDEEELMYSYYGVNRAKKILMIPVKYMDKVRYIRKISNLINSLTKNERKLKSDAKEYYKLIKKNSDIFFEQLN